MGRLEDSFTQFTKDFRNLSVGITPKVGDVMAGRAAQWQVESRPPRPMLLHDICPVDAEDRLQTIYFSITQDKWLVFNIPRPMLEGDL